MLYRHCIWRMCWRMDGKTPVPLKGNLGSIFFTIRKNFREENFISITALNNLIKSKKRFDPSSPSGGQGFTDPNNNHTPFPPNNPVVSHYQNT
jgi:hypothetical protein